MTKCKNCGKVINSKLTINCTCGSFCSIECLDDQIMKDEREEDDKVLNEDSIINGIKICVGSLLWK